MSAKVDRRRGKRTGAHIDVLAEVVRYGRDVLGMNDGDMGKELGYTRQRIEQARKRGGVVGVWRCKEGHKLPKGLRVYCPRCNPLPKEGSILCLRPGCKRMSVGGECSYHANLRRIREDDATRERHRAASKNWRKGLRPEAEAARTRREREASNRYNAQEARRVG